MTCSRTCGGGRRKKMRHKLPEHQNCEGKRLEQKIEECNTQSCGKYDML